MERRVLFAIGLSVLLPAIGPGPLLAGTRLVPSSRIHVAGASHFSCEEIAEKLSQSLLNHRVLSPKSPVDDVPEFFEEQILKNYHRSGFLDASTQSHVDYETGEYHIEIEEGSQYVAGDVGVSGLPESDVDAFLEELVSPGVPVEATIDRFAWRGEKWEPVWVDESGKVTEVQPSSWTPGRPVRSPDSLRPPVTRDIHRALAAIGRTTAEIQVAPLERGENTVPLAVNITNLGAPALGRHMRVTGGERNSQEDILTYLEVKPDEVLTGRRLEEMRLRLWLSGRFVRSRFHIAPPKGPDSPPDVTCEVEEHEGAPPLLAPVSDAEEIVLRFHRWLSQLPESDETLLLEFPLAPVEFTVQFAASHGFLARIDKHYLLAHSDRVVYCPSQRKAKLVIPLDRLSAAIDLSFDPKAGPQKEARKRHLQFNANLTTSPPNSESRPVLLGMFSSPHTWLDLLHSPDTHSSMEDGVLNLEFGQSAMRIDAETGRLLKRVDLDKNGERQLIVSPVSNDLRSVCRNLESAWEEYPDCYCPTESLSSIVRFVGADPVIRQFLLEAVAKKTKRAIDDRQMAVLLQLLHGAVLPTADEMWINWQQERSRTFPPFHAFGARELYSDALEGTAPKAIAAFTIGALQLFSRGTWPYDLVGAAGFAWARSMNLYRYHSETLFRTQVRSPIRDMLVAEWFKRTHPATANSIAWRGLSHLDQEGFFEDRAVLLDEGCYFGRFLLHVAETLQDLDEGEVADLMAACLGGPEPGFATAAFCLRARRDRPAWEVLPDAIEAGWETAWRDSVKARLSEVVKTTQPAIPRWKADKKANRDGNVRETSSLGVKAERPFSQRAKSAAQPLWETTPDQEDDPLVPQTGSRFELQGPFSK